MEARVDGSGKGSGKVMNDPAQEFAERVAANYFGQDDDYHCGGGKKELADLIASELRAEGWVAPLPSRWMQSWHLRSGAYIPPWACR
jgi:hypothetical protein